MASNIKVDQIEGSSGSSITIPTGQTLTIADGLATASLPTVPVSKGGTGLTSLGTAEQAIRVNAGANALEFYTPTGGAILQVKETQYSAPHGFNNANFTKINDAVKVDMTAQQANSSFLVEVMINVGSDHHDAGCAVGFFDSLKGDSGDANAFPPISTRSDVGSRTKVAVVGHWSMGSSDNTENHSQMNYSFSYLYTPASGQQSTSARSFYPCMKRNTDNQQLLVNYAQNNEGRSFAGVSYIRVMEIANSVVV